MPFRAEVLKLYAHVHMRREVARQMAGNSSDFLPIMVKETKVVPAEARTQKNRSNRNSFCLHVVCIELSIARLWE